MLNYDDSAFKFFFVAILACYLIPATIYTLNAISSHVWAKSDPNQKKDPTKKPKTLFTPCFTVHTLMTLALWSLLAFTVSTMKGNTEIASFDPYKILELDVGSEMSEIKKQYRKLSLKYHPDRNIGDPIAEDMFVKISKAHDVLTDDEARENYEKYGNPDGRQAMQLSIGLPTFLLDKENHAIILLVYLICLVILIPTVVGLWWTYKSKYGEGDVMANTYKTFVQLLSETLPIRNMLEILGASQEFINLEYNQKEQQEILKYYKLMMKERSMAKPRRYVDKCLTHGMRNNPKAGTLVCNNVVLHRHLLQQPLKTKRMRSNLQFMLRNLPKLIEGLIFMSTIAGKRFWLSCTMNIIKLSQFLTQGLWVQDHPFFQLPHFTKREVSQCLRGKKKGVKTIRQYLELSQEDRKGLVDFNEDQKRDVMDACNRMSLFDIDVKPFVEDETEIATNDLVTVRVTITRKNLKDGEFARPVLTSANHPKDQERRENIWVLLSSILNQKGLCRHLSCLPKKISDQGRVVTTDLKIRAPPKPGTYNYSMLVMSDCYMGLDVEQKITLKVIPEQDLPAYEVHPEDAELDAQPSLFAVTTENDFMEDSESDDDGDDDDDDGKGASNEDSSESKKKGGESKKNGAIDLSDSSSDEDEDGI